MFVCWKKNHFNPFLSQCAFGAMFAQNCISRATLPLASILANPKSVPSGAVPSRDTPQPLNPVLFQEEGVTTCGMGTPHPCILCAVTL